MFSYRLAVSTGGGIAYRREKFKGRKGDKGGDPLFFCWEENKPTIWKNFCAVKSWVCLLLISSAQYHQMGLILGLDDLRG